MRITDSTLAMRAQTSQWTRQQSSQTLQLDVEPARPRPAPSGETVTLGKDARGTAPSDKATGVQDERSRKGADALRLQILIDIVEQITGYKIELFDPAELADVEQTASPDDAAAAAPDLNWSLHFERHEIREEAEQVSFGAKGAVRTADGREIAFSLDLQMARYERQEDHVVIDAGTPRRKDPLMLNLLGGAASLASERIDFDLDVDGKADSISRPGRGSVFLALDRNGNGAIDDGSELFGAKTGEGFGELAALDEDGNGWIDEGDSAFAKLQVWDGAHGLQSLTQAGIGALALAHAATPFTLKLGGDDRGLIRATGVFLREDGTPGLVQHVDLTV